MQTHPEESVLLRYFDGELPARRARQTARHLEACWQCRTRIDEMQSTVADCVHYRQDVLQAHLPAPPAGWADLANGFARIDAELAAESWAARLGGWLAAPKARRWAIPGALAAAVAAGTFFQLRETPSVQAAVLLKRAVAVAETRPLAKRQIRVRTRTEQFTLADGSAAPAIRALFQAARYNGEDPLSAKSYQEWRDGLSSKTDEVETLAGAYRIRTAAAEGALAVATLRLRTTDLHPTEGRFEFRNQEWVELTEVTEASTRDDGLSVETNVGAPMRRAVPSRPETAASAGSASISHELQVVAALHEIGADLGDPLEVTHSGNAIVVSGIGISAARQKQIQQALEPIPNLAVRFAAPPAAPDTPAATGAPSVPGRPGAIQSRFEQQLGGRAEFARFSAQILDWNEAAMARAYALRGLAQRFPADTALAMTAEDREVLTEIARQHLAALAANVTSIQRTLAPVLVSLGGATAQGRPVTSQDAWQAAAETLFQAARRVEVRLSAVLGATQDSDASDRVASDLIAALADLRANLDQCQRLVR